jgi:drug/metabolite transporter (DMT)-like permease
MMRVKEENTGMEVLSKLERIVAGWLKSVPHLPNGTRRWLGDNVWWFAVVGVVLGVIGVLGLIVALLGSLSTLANPIVVYYASSTFLTWVIIKTIIALVFAGFQVALLAFAVNPLKEKQKKGWVLLFAVLLLGALSTVVNALITLNPFGFITSVIFGALWLAVLAYFLFEIHGQFAHVERSKGVKAKKAPKASD